MDYMSARIRILDMIDEGSLDAKEVVLMCLKWMPEDDVLGMAKANEINLEGTEDAD